MSYRKVLINRGFYRSDFGDYRWKDWNAMFNQVESYCVLSYGGYETIRTRVYKDDIIDFDFNLSDDEIKSMATRYHIEGYSHPNIIDHLSLYCQTGVCVNKRLHITDMKQRIKVTVDLGTKEGMKDVFRKLRDS